MARVETIASVLVDANTAREQLGASLVLLSSAYGVSDTYGVGPLGSEPVEQNREYLDGIRARAEVDYRSIPEGNDPLSDALRNQIAFDIASIESATNQTLNIFGGGTALGDLADSIRDGIGDIPNLLPRPPGGSWWIWIGAVAAFVLWLKFRK